MQNDRHPVVVILLIPFAFLYWIITGIRNLLFNLGIFKSKEFKIPVISVGNISVGGTGKTPHAEYLIRLLKDQYRIAILSRGYKRKSSGFVLAGNDTGVLEIGDEPMQIKNKFPEIEVAVDESRVHGVERLISIFPDIDIVILDDAFQHRWIKPGLSILLVDYNRRLNSDFMLPAGTLREPVNAIKRADIVIVTKCPGSIKPIERRILKKELALYPYQSLFFTSFNYGALLGVFSNTPSFKSEPSLPANIPFALVVTGIASPNSLLDFVQTITSGFVHLSFPDHHNYTPADILKIEKRFADIPDKNKIVLTTEKDAVRFKTSGEFSPGLKNRFYYVPVSVTFFGNSGDLFDKQLLSFVKKQG